MKKFILFLSVFAFANEVKILELQSSCDNKNMSDCYELGNAYSFGDGVKQDYKKAVELFSKACEDKVADACWSL